MISVQIGPRNRDANHQLKPLRPLLCAKPALMTERVNQPTAYWPEFSIEVISVRSDDVCCKLRSKHDYSSERGMFYYKTSQGLESFEPALMGCRAMAEAEGEHLGNRFHHPVIKR